MSEENKDKESNVYWERRSCYSFDRWTHIKNSVYLLLGRQTSTIGKFFTKQTSKYPALPASSQRAPWCLGDMIAQAIYIYIYNTVCRQFADRRFGDSRKGAGRILDRRKYAYIYLLFFRPIYIYIYYTSIQCQFYLKSYQNHTDSYIIKIQNQTFRLL